MTDIDNDGDSDRIYACRKKGTFWAMHPGVDNLDQPWKEEKIRVGVPCFFMAMGDVNGDGLEDFVIAGGYSKGVATQEIFILLRKDKDGEPAFDEVVIKQVGRDVAGDNLPTFPKGIGLLDLDGDNLKDDIVVLPRAGDMWSCSYTGNGDPKEVASWKTQIIEVPGVESRLKMDNAYIGDIDGDGDEDVVTTEENGGWGVIWFENPLISAAPGAGVALPSDERKTQVLHEDDFSGDISQWVPEHQPEGSVKVIDDVPYTSGWFGFRTVNNHMMIDNFRVTRLGDD